MYQQKSLPQGSVRKRSTSCGRRTDSGTLSPYLEGTRSRRMGMGLEAASMMVGVMAVELGSDLNYFQPRLSTRGWIQIQLIEFWRVLE